MSVLYSHALSFPFGRHLGVKSLGHVEGMFFFLRDCCAVSKGFYWRLLVSALTRKELGRSLFFLRNEKKGGWTEVSDSS